MEQNLTGPCPERLSLNFPQVQGRKLIGEFIDGSYGQFASRADFSTPELAIRMESKLNQAEGNTSCTISLMISPDSGKLHAQRIEQAEKYQKRPIKK